MKMSSIALNVFAVVLLVLLALSLFGCQNQPAPPDFPVDDTSSGNSTNDNNNSGNSNSQSGDSELEIITIKTDGSFTQEECEKRALDDKVFMLESAYCPHCKETLPDFKEACAEKGVEPIILDLSIAEHRGQMLSHGITIAYTPTFVFGCDYFIGGRSKEFYLQAMDKFLENQKG